MKREGVSVTLDRIAELALIPVIRIEDARDAQDLAAALTAAGLPQIEITFRTAAAEDAIRHIASAFPDVVLGAGTVLSADQARRAVGAGAQFVVSPGFNPHTVDWCLEHQVPIIPGVATPTEIEMALDKGLKILKFFPAEVLGGVRMLKALSGPYGDVKFVPTGGVNARNLADYLGLANVHACAGSWLAPSDRISAGAFDAITELARQGLSLVQQCRR